MRSLAEILTHPERRPQVVDACAVLIEQEVKTKSGLSGLAVKAGYKLVRAIKPSMIPDVVNKLLPEFAEALQPMFAEAEDKSGAAGDRFVAHLQADPARVAAALLTVTDRRAESASGPLQKTYHRLRSTAGDHVQLAVPGLARTLGPFL